LLHKAKTHGTSVRNSIHTHHMGSQQQTQTAKMPTFVHVQHDSTQCAYKTKIGVHTEPRNTAQVNTTQYNGIMHIASHHITKHNTTPVHIRSTVHTNMHEAH